MGWVGNQQEGSGKTRTRVGVRERGQGSGSTETSSIGVERQGPVSDPVDCLVILVPHPKTRHP